MLLYTYRSFDMELPTVDIKDADYIILGLPLMVPQAINQEQDSGQY